MLVSAITLEQVTFGRLTTVEGILFSQFHMPYDDISDDFGWFFLVSMAAQHATATQT